MSCHCTTRPPSSMSSPMASLLFPPFSSRPTKLHPNSISLSSKRSFLQNANFPFSSLHFKLHHPPRKHPKFSAKDEEEREVISSSTLTVAPEKESDEKATGRDGDGEEESEEKTQKQEVDWKADEQFKKFMGNPSIEAAIKLEKKRADRKLKELDVETDSNPITGFFKRIIRDSLAREKERLEKAEESFKALDLNKVYFRLLSASACRI